jgi:tetrahydromethanopterin S-methyltransferase subunit C
MIIRPIVVWVIIGAIIWMIVGVIIRVIVRMIVRMVIGVVVRMIVVMAVVGPIIIVGLLNVGVRDGPFERRRREREGGRGAARDHEHCRSGESAEHAA